MGKASRADFLQRLRTDYAFRTLVFSVGGFLGSVLFGVYNGVLGIVGRSVWFCSLAAYYILLAFLRGGILRYHGRKKSKLTAAEMEKREIRIYRNGGVLLLVLNLALSVAIVQMVFSVHSFYYPSWTVYGYAAYAFYKITMAIVHLVKSKKQVDLTVRSVRNINLAAAAVSILALQTALLQSFGEGANGLAFNAFTGAVVALLNIALGVSMIATAIKKGKKNAEEV